MKAQSQRLQIFFVAKGFVALLAVSSSFPAASALDPGLPQPDRAQAWTWCVRANPQAVSLDLSISGCTSILRSGRETPDNLAVAFHNRGLAYLSKGENDRALKDFDEAIRLKPDFVEAIGSRAAAAGNAGDYDRAIQDSTRVLELRPWDERAFYNRGTAYGNQGRYDLAIHDLDEGIRLRPDFAEALNNRCWFRALGNLALGSALADCNEALRLMDGNATILIEARGGREPLFPCLPYPAGVRNGMQIRIRSF